VPTFDPRPLQQLVGRSLARPRFQTAVLASFAVAALILACAGLYGVVSFVTGRRVREIGVRQALGASRAAVRRQVLGRGMGLVGVGTALGLALSLATGRLLEGSLHGVDPLDPTVHAAGIAVLVAVALSASWLPARRASRVDPALILREE